MTSRVGALVAIVSLLCSSGRATAQITEGTGASLEVDEVDSTPTGSETAIGPPSAAQEPVPAPPAALRITVVRLSPDGPERALAGVPVRLEPWGGEATEIAEAVTDESGTAQLDVTSSPSQRYEVVAEVGQELTASRPLIAAVDGQQARVEAYESRPDATHVRARRLVTVSRLHEGYVVFEQYYVLTMDAPYVFEAGDGPADGIEVHLPEGAEGIQIIRPSEDEGGATAGDSGVLFRGPVGPPGVILEEGPDLVVSFSLPLEASEHRFEQVMPFPVDEAAIIVPQTTEFSRFPQLDVELYVPQCGNGTTVAEMVCFPDPTRDVVGPIAVWDGDRREVWGGVGETGATLLFETRGWPVQRNPFRAAALFGAIVIVLVGGWLWVKRRPGLPVEQPLDAVPRERLELERRRLLLALKDARDTYEEGELARSEWEGTELVLRHRLEQVYRALGVPPGAPAGAPDRPAPLARPTESTSAADGGS